MCMYAIKCTCICTCKCTCKCTYHKCECNVTMCLQKIYLHPEVYLSLYVSFITVWAAHHSTCILPSAPAYSLGVPWPGNVPPGSKRRVSLAVNPVWRGEIISIYIYIRMYIIHIYIYTCFFVIVCVYVFCVA